MLAVQYATFQHNETHRAKQNLYFVQVSSQHKTEVMFQNKRLQFTEFRLSLPNY